jgi:hypothetical protein
MNNQLHPSFYEYFKKASKRDLNFELVKACENNELHVVQYLLTSKELKTHADIYTQESKGFIVACGKGYVDIAKYLVESDELEDHINPSFNDNNGFKVACENGHLGIVSYLLNSTKLSTSNEQELIDSGLNDACCNNHLDVVRYLLTSPELKTHANLHANNDSAFKMACIYGHTDILNYFIFDMNIKQTADMQEYLEKYPNEKAIVDNLFKVRDLHNELKNDLASEKINKKRAIKL